MTYILTWLALASIPASLIGIVIILATDYHASRQGKKSDTAWDRYVIRLEKRS